MHDVDQQQASEGRWTISAARDTFLSVHTAAEDDDWFRVAHTHTLVGASRPGSEWITIYLVDESYWIKLEPESELTHLC